jgi:biotin carboxyl carrier protein
MMFTPDEIALLVACMKRNGVAELDLREDSEELRLVGAAGARQGASHAPRPSARTILATAFGVLHLEENVGASVEAGGIIATVAAGPLRRPIVSPVAGRLTRILGRQDQRVEYGTPLFEILEAKGLS